LIVYALLITKPVDALNFVHECFTGTGNGIATITMGNKDIVSAAYTIVLGNWSFSH